MNRFFIYNSGRIHYTDQGKGSPIVLIHGYLETSEIWSSFAKKLAGNFRVITVDLPGHGRSDMYDAVYTMNYMATCISKLLEHLELRKAFVTGHSLGGYITLAFAELYPEMLSGYCLMHSQPFSDDADKIEKRNAEIDLVKDGKKDTFIPGNITKLYATANLQKFSEALLRSREIALKIPGETIISVLKGMIARPSRVSVMESGRIPCLWILGAFDNLINCEAIQAKVKLPENAEIIILKNSGHMGFIEEEDLSVKVIAGFVKKLK
ncbi:MAG: alpha/beta hydrolase [Bacteroidales bacterium]|jgi:pimeloyl-ACP methyl ester carboxylesterase|nr:alpha/beta hydrolase [Bacteroidales bacterium]